VRAASLRAWRNALSGAKACLLTEHLTQETLISSKN